MFGHWAQYFLLLGMPAVGVERLRNSITGQVHIVREHMHITVSRTLESLSCRM